MSPTADFPVPPAHGYRGGPPGSGEIAPPPGPALAVSREAGARGGAVARRAGELLGWQVFDSEALDYLAQDDDARARFLADLPAAGRTWAAAQRARLGRRDRVSADPDAAAMVELLLAVAARGEVVVVGRGAGFVLPPETTVHVRVVAPAEARVAYFAQWLRLSPEEAAAEVRDRDGKRAAYLALLTGRDPADPTGYDAVVNAARLGVEGAARFIEMAVRAKRALDETRDAGGAGA